MRSHISHRLVGLALAAGPALAPAAAAAAEVSPSPAWSQKRLEGLTPGGDTPVELHNGSFHHEIEIEAPDFHGIAPELALAFNSSAGNGFAGVGWSLRAASVIERVGPSGHGSRTCTASDGYTLDGQPLVPCTALGGTHCTKQQSFQRIRFDAGNDRWFVWDTDGTRSTYTKIFHVASCQYRYGLASVEDTSGNKVSYTWATDQPGVHQEVYPATVRYGGVTVTFFREARPDAITYANGFDWSAQRLRLKSVLVTVNSNGLAGGGTEQTLLAYKLGYDPSPTTGRSRLVSVAQYGRDVIIDAEGTISAGAVLSTQTFSYGGGSAGFQPTALVGGLADGSGWNDVTNYSTIQTPDIDGDGKADVCGRANAGIHCSRFTGQGWAGFPRINGSPAWGDASGWNKPQYYSTIRYPDLNGDGKADVCARSSVGLHCLLNDGAASPAFTTALPVLPFSDASGWDQHKHYSTIQFADVNGDGKDDACFRSAAGVACRLVAANGTTWGPAFDGPDWSDATGWGDVGNYSTIRFPDINGDGRADVCGRANARVFCRLSSGAAFGATDWLGPEWSDAHGWNQPKHYSTIQYPDINGDGKADICGRTAIGVRCHLAIGSARVQDTFYAFNTIAIETGEATDAQAATPKHYETLGFADINGDGRQDLCWRGAGGINCARSTGAAFTRAVSNSPGWSDASGWGDPGNYSTVRFVDVDGDGKSDVFGRSNDGLRAHRSGGDGVERLTAITNNGLGGSVTIGYAPLSSFRNTNNPPTDQVVTSLTVDDGRGHRATTTFSYDGGQYDRPNKRSLGFRHVKRTLPAIAGEATAPSEEVWFMQSPYACVGQIDFNKRSTGDGRLLVYSQRRYQSDGAGAGPFTCLLDQRSDHLYDASGNTTCTAQDNTHCKRTDVNHDYDAHGNVTVSYDYGDYFNPEDDTTTETFFNRNLAAYIVDTEMVERLHAGIGTTGAMLDETRTLYDGAVALDTPPVVGLPTMVQEWVSNVGGPQPGAAYLVTRKGYDSFGNVISEEDALGHRTRHAYDGVFRRFVVSTTNALEQTGTTTWDTVCGVPLIETDANGQATRSRYDEFCRLTREDEPLGGFTAHVYSALGNALAQWTRIETPPVPGIAGNVYQVSYLDGLGRTYRSQERGSDPVADDDVLLETEFDARGNVRTRSLPRPEGAPAVLTTLDHDELDRPIKAAHADGSVASTSYNLWTTVATDEVGKQVARTVDADGRVVTVGEKEGAFWHVALYSYDLRGNPLRTVDPAGNVTTYQFNSRDQKLAQSDPDLGASSYTYDANGQLLTETDARGQRTELAYDALGRITSKRLGAEGETPEVTTYAYDEERPGYFNVGRRTTMRDPAGLASYDHDAAGREARGTRSLGGAIHTFHRSFDPGDRLLGIRYPDGDVVGDDPTTAEAERAFGYDAAGQLRSIPGIVDSVSYQPDGQIAQIANANGTTSARSYSPTRSWLDAIKTTRGAVRVQDLTYARDREGKITAVSSPVPGDGWSYGYDLLGRLTTAGQTSGRGDQQSFSYDKIGNLITNSRLGKYSYPPAGAPRPHAVTSIGEQPFRYDAAGNMLEGNGRGYRWDAANRLVEVTMGGRVTTFLYDGDGERLEKSHDGTVTRYLGDDYEIGPRGTITKYFRLGGELVAKKVDTSRFWFHGNHVDSVSVITDEGGNEVRRESQRAYGETLDSAGIHEESFGFTGQRADETGLVYLHARYYDPVIGRFLSPDTETPGDLVIALNRYAYANDDPVNYLDPSGHWSLKSIGKFALTTAVAVGVGLAFAGCAVSVVCAVAVAATTFVAVTATGFAYDSLTTRKGWKEKLKDNAIEGGFAAIGGGIGKGVGWALNSGRRYAAHSLKEEAGRSLQRSTDDMLAYQRGMTLAQRRAMNNRHLADHMRANRAAARAEQAERRKEYTSILGAEVGIEVGTKYTLKGAKKAVTSKPAAAHAVHWRAKQRARYQPRPPLPPRRCCFMPSPHGMGSRPKPPPPRRGGGCFVAGTMVTMADGTQKAIDRIQVGERVLAFDEKSGRVLASPVTQVFVHRDWRDRAGTILVNGRLRATDNHPFYVNGSWQQAEQLRPGELLRSLTPGPADLGPTRTIIPATVDSLTPLPGVDTVYNLEVEGYHTYFAEGFLVHNMVTKY